MRSAKIEQLKKGADALENDTGRAQSAGMSRTRLINVGWPQEDAIWQIRVKVRTAGRQRNAAVAMVRVRSSKRLRCAEGQGNSRGGGGSEQRKRGANADSREEGWKLELDRRAKRLESSEASPGFVWCALANDLWACVPGIE